MANRTIAARASFMMFSIVGGTLAIFTLITALALVAQMVMLA